MTSPRLIASHYEVGTEIGAGGHGTVYRGVDTSNNQPVAIKLLKADAIAHDSGLIERFQREAAALRELNHPNIVKVLDILEDDGQHYLILEYVGGGSLFDVLERGQTRQLSLRRVLENSLDVADALTRAHRLQIIHRDLKPANVLLTEDGSPRLTDFGVAQIRTKKRVTGTGLAIGTPDYMPPEMLEKGLSDPRTDIWSFGVMLFEILTGQRPFVADSLTGVLVNIMTKQPPDLQELRPDCPIALADLVYRMLEKDPNQRIPSVRLIGAELEALLQGMSVDTSQIQAQFDGAVQAKDDRFATPTPTIIGIPHNLPTQATPFVGREHELSELQKLLNNPNTRLITILGPGGMGKTRLALEIGENIVEPSVGTRRASSLQSAAFINGVYIVELAPQNDPNNILSAVASATGYPFQSDERTPKQQLLDFFSEKHLLLIMDNFEHLLEGADLMSDILQAAPHVKIVATSRERLNLQEETLFRIEGMDFPDWETPADALEYSAVKLFMQSARRARPDFELKAEDLLYVARICRMVQGMPLGIVLAAAWVDSLSLKEIAEEIGRNVDFLETQARNMPQRHRSIRAVFDYSWNLLAEAERAVFIKLSVFRGGFTREAAEAVASANLRTLMSLMNKSLIRRSAESGRYDIHEITRQYAEARLQEAGEEAATQQALAEYFADWMAERHIDLKGRRQLGALDDVEIEYENIRAVWQWAYQHNERNIINRMLDGLYWGHDIRGQYREGVANLLAAEQALSVEKDAVFHRVRMRRIRHVFLGVNDFPFEDAEIVECLAAARSNDDKVEIIFCLNALGLLLNLRGAYVESQTYTEEAYQLSQKLGDLFCISEALVYRGLALHGQGKADEALPVMSHALELKERIGDVNGVAWTSFNYTFIVAALGDYASAEKSIERGVDNMRQLKTPQGMIMMTGQMAWMSLINGDIAKAHETAISRLQLAIDKNSFVGIIQGATVLELTAGLMNDTSEITQKAFEYLKTTPIELIQQHTPSGLAQLCFALDALRTGDDETAKAEFVLAMKLFSKFFGALFPLVLVFALKAIVDAHDGHRESAAMWLSTAFHYPYQGAAWLEDWGFSTRLRSDLKVQLGTAAFNAAWERGKTRNMDTAINELLAEYADHSG